MGDSKIKRPPVVVVLGHVDHGKSSLLEAIREEFKIVAKEAGGITQHIGAYVADYEGKKITFLDTPGHEAFSAMRSRGARVADIGILVVAGDDGVKPQTKEAIAQAQAVSLPLIVAITKADKPGIDVAKVKSELAKEGVIVESIGGQVPCLETSALAKKGIRELLEMILLVADLQDLNVELTVPGRGFIIEVSQDAKRGIQSTLLLKEGQLKSGDAVGTPSAAGKIKIMEDWNGDRIQTIDPSFPVRIIGFETSPLIGEEVHMFHSVEEAKAQAQEPPPKISREQQGDKEQQTRQIVLKADVAGSLEAIEQMIRAFVEGPQFVVAKGDVGDVTEGDVKFARDTKAQVIAFRVKVPSSVARFAEVQGVQVARFEVIYDIAEHLQNLIEEAKRPLVQGLGSVKILATFSAEKDRQVVGGKVISGVAKRGAAFEIARQEEIVGKGKVLNLQQQKKDSVVVAKGNEAGLMVQTDQIIQEGDVLNFIS